MASKLWVKLSPHQPIKVPVEGCQDVDDFLEACKKKLLFMHGEFPPGDMSLSVSVGETPLHVDADISCLHIQNSARTPLYISVLAVVSQPLQQARQAVWQAIGTVTGARKMRFRRGLYRAAVDYLGFYEECGGPPTERINPFAYQDDGSLLINVLFKIESQALHFRAHIYDKVFAVSPYGELKASLEVVSANCVLLGQQILATDFVRDENSPAETSTGRFSVVSELNESSPLFKYQRLENYKFFGGLLSADRAHLIDKPLCAKGEQFEKYAKNENNFLALSKDAHCYFDALTNVFSKMPFFKLVISGVSDATDPENDDRYRVELIVEAYDVATAAMFFPRLKEGSTQISDLKMETFVYVKKPDEFRECLAWKTARIEALWQCTPAVE